MFAVSHTLKMRYGDLWQVAILLSTAWMSNQHREAECIVQGHTDDGAELAGKRWGACRVTGAGEPKPRVV